MTNQDRGGKSRESEEKAPNESPRGSFLVSSVAARQAFFGAVHRRVPEVFEDLAREPFARLGQDGLEAALTAWQERWHLGADWCRELAIETLEEWSLLKETAKVTGLAMLAETLRQRRPASGLVEISPRKVRIEFEERTLDGRLIRRYRKWVDIDSEPPWRTWDRVNAPWFPDTGETRSAARARLLALAARAIDDYLDLVKKTRPEGGPISGTTRRRIKRDPEHLEWLAMYQCGGMQWWEFDRPRKTVVEGVSSAAELVGLPLRPCPPRKTGRPRKLGG
ncbi:MAG TPA: hypothetical protein PLP31_00890 [Thermoanaerobaculaceae bacterium]|nr:hypothetical protein [Thermoanaerobaculaceae bacterium]